MFTNKLKRHKGHLIRLQVFTHPNTQTIKHPNVQTKSKIKTIKKQRISSDKVHYK